MDDEYPTRTIAAIWAQIVVQGLLLAAPVLVPLAVVVVVLVTL